MEPFLQASPAFGSVQTMQGLWIQIEVHTLEGELKVDMLQSLSQDLSLDCKWLRLFSCLVLEESATDRRAKMLLLGRPQTEHIYTSKC